MAGIEDADDFAVFFDPDGFGSLGSYALAAGSPAVEVGGIFTAAHAVAAPLGDWPGVSTSTPVFTCRAAMLPAGAGDGDTLTLGATAWTVRSIQPDGTGLARLILERT
ncbi:hypothetical protein [Amaricoccus sp.]|uniref:head-tail joining protein n=1 Tax=Amaricoccus sp. TaxID=1872485 RepID=UPI001B4E6F3B|nr:hypothetical protein [Amaricoccus sp.]MBP7001715.1 hypothetical protein [Amaricoccus sp.]